MGLSPRQTQVLALLSVVVVAVLATYALMRIELRQSAGRLRAADQEQALIAADVGEYEDRLRAAQAMVGGSSRALAIVAEDASNQLSEAAGYQVTCLSVLETVVTVAEVAPQGKRAEAVAGYFEGAKTRMQAENTEPEIEPAPYYAEKERLLGHE